MENREIIQAINNNYERARTEYLKGLKKRKKRMIIHNIIYSILLVLILGLLIYMVNYETKRALNKCMDNGHSYNYCIQEVR